MNKKALGLTTLMLGTSLCSKIAYNEVKPVENVNLERKLIAKASSKSETEVAEEYIESEAKATEEQKAEILARIASIIGGGNSASTYSTTTTTFTEYDMFYGLGSGDFWDAVADRYTLSKVNDITNCFEIAINYVNHYYSRNLSDDASDAYRHIVAIALLTNMHGSSFAREFMTFHAGYNGSDIAQLNRYSMDCHNNEIGVMIGVNYMGGYKNSMSGSDEMNIGKYAAHVVKFGSYYDVLELTSDDLGFQHTTEGIQNITFPPFC